ncbi:NAD(P)/FAD-dependent oxidoreductase [Chloroflexota bacterium]
MQVVIIGNGIAGSSAAFAIREASDNTKITVISKEPHPLYSPCALPNFLAGEIERDRLFINTHQHYADSDIATILGHEVNQIDTKSSRVILDNGSLAFDRLIFAAGSQPAVLPIEGRAKPGVFNLKRLADADSITASPGKKAVIIGSGMIGMEAAIALKKQGWKVVVIEFLDWVLPRIFDERPAQKLRAIVEDHDIEVLTGERVQKIAGDSQVSGVATDKREIDCDLVLTAAGMRPNVELAKQTGLTIGKFGGICTDEYMRTNIENIYACGDCAETKDAITGRSQCSLLWHNAKEQGVVAGLYSIGIKKRYPGSRNISGITIFATYAFSIGGASAGIGYDNVEIIEREYNNDYRRFIITEGRVIGAQVIGSNRYIGMLLGIMRRGDTISRIWQGKLNQNFGALPLMAITKNYLV